MIRVLDRYGNIKTITTTVITGETDPIWTADKPDYLTILSASASYSPLGHTHTFASLTSKPTTIADYGITDYNSLWDTRLALKTTTNLTEGANLYFTDARAITALTGENISIFTNDAGYLTSLSGAVPTSRNLTINGTTYDLSADRTWTVGSVTSASVVSANGFAGTVATATSTPAITISTSITGLLKGNGTAISAAVSNTDYLPVASPTATGTFTVPTISLSTTISGAGTWAAGAINTASNVSGNLFLATSGVRTGNNTNIYWNSGPVILGNTNDVTIKNAAGSAGANVSIGSTAAATCAQLDITSTTRGLLLPRMTKTQRDAISTPLAGLAVYQTDNTPGLRVYNGTNWMRFTETID